MAKYTPVSGIYVILNTKNGKMYLGQTQNCRNRWMSHKSKLNKGCHENKHLQAAWIKYGGKMFKFSILEYCPIDHLNEREQHFINIYTAKGLCYNIVLDVKAPMRGLSHSDETRKKISLAQKGKPFNDEHLRNLREANKYKSEEHRQKLRDVNLGKKHTDETKQKISELSQNMSEETKRKIGEKSKGNTHNIGRVHTDETKHKISLANKGKTISDEQRQQISAANKGSKRTDEQRKRMSEAQRLIAARKRAAKLDTTE